jgi:hypothetical protein
MRHTWHVPGTFSTAGVPCRAEITPAEPDLASTSEGSYDIENLPSMSRVLKEGARGGTMGSAA